MSEQRKLEGHWDAIIIGTGFGGSMTALQLARAGKRVLILDRGVWVDRDESAWDTRAILIDQKYRSPTPYEAPQIPMRSLVHPNETVGGSSIFYGAASMRFRESDFRRRSQFQAIDPHADQFVDWPITYDDLEPYYQEAEQLLGVTGVAGLDPTEPARSGSYASAPPPFAKPAQRIVDAATKLGLKPFPIPLAINFHGAPNRQTCIRCNTCDLYPCKIGAKNDLTVTILPMAAELGATIRGQTLVTRLVHQQGRIEAIEGIDTARNEPFRITCDVAIVAAGSIPSARLLLTSGLEDLGPNGKLIGRYLMRHCPGIVIGIFPFDTNPEQAFHKQVALSDFALGHPEGLPPAGPWGIMQSLHVPPPEYIELGAPFPINKIGAMNQPRMIFLICIAEDIPSSSNRVTLHRSRSDQWGQPIADVYYRGHKRDRQARSALYREGARVLREAGAVIRARKPIPTFSHAVGTCRFGHDPHTAVLDEHCNFFGVKNLFVVDGSFMPTAAGVNPSLTIAANALRVGRHIAGAWDDHTAAPSTATTS